MLYNKPEEITTIDGHAHLVNLVVTCIAACAAGEYRWQARVTEGVERYTLDGVLSPYAPISL